MYLQVDIVDPDFRAWIVIRQAQSLDRLERCRSREGLDRGGFPVPEIQRSVRDEAFPRFALHRVRQSLDRDPCLFHARHVHPVEVGCLGYLCHEIHEQCELSNGDPCGTRRTESSRREQQDQARRDVHGIAERGLQDRCQRAVLHHHRPAHIVEGSEPGDHVTLGASDLDRLRRGERFSEEPCDVLGGGAGINAVSAYYPTGPVRDDADHYDRNQDDDCDDRIDAPQDDERDDASDPCSCDIAREVEWFNDVFDVVSHPADDLTGTLVETSSPWQLVDAPEEVSSHQRACAEQERGVVSHTEEDGDRSARSVREHGGDHPSEL